MTSHRNTRTGTWKKWLTRVMVGTGVLLAGLVSLFLIGSLLARAVSIQRAAREFPPPGRLVEIDGRRSHIQCVGEGSPTIVLESGLDDRGSWSWSLVQDDLAKFSRVCSYDRAGLLWSEPGRDPRDAETIGTELNALLTAASETPPYVMVGHSFGGLYMRVYDHLYPGEVAGFVFVDSSHPEQEQRFPQEVRERVAEGASEPSPRWLFRLLAPYRIITGERATPRTAYWWRSFPEGVLPESEAAYATYEQARRTGSLGLRPVVVLTSGVAPVMPGVSAEGNAAMRQTLLDLHGELARLSSSSDHRIVEGSGHYIHRDRPEALVTAVKDVVEAVRNSDN